MATTNYATLIRVRNESDTDFYAVVVGDKEYGDIESKATTTYQPWLRAYRYAPVTLIADAQRMQFQPIDYVGEHELGPGQFTYIITVREGQLDIRVER